MLKCWLLPCALNSRTVASVVSCLFNAAPRNNVKPKADDNARITNFATFIHHREQIDEAEGDGDSHHVLISATVATCA